MFVNAAMALVAAAGIGAASLAAQPPKPASPGKVETPPKPADNPTAKPETSEDTYVLGFKMKRIDGTEEDLSKYKGKVVVIVNVASKCGYTPQYEALQKLYEDKKDQGLVILGFPANNFGSQEPGTNQEIVKFCSDNYHVGFPMFEKISVKGSDQHALYKKLAGQPPPIGGDPKWNFTKFVVDKSGNVVARFDAKNRKGLEPDLLKKLDELLGGEKAGDPAPKTKPAGVN
jgi:glutathione peroxidase